MYKTEAKAFRGLDVISQKSEVIYCTYSSINSIGLPSLVSNQHILASISSVVGLGSCLVKYGGLLNEQHVLVAVQFCPSQRGSYGWKPEGLPEMTPDSQK